MSITFTVHTLFLIKSFPSARLMLTRVNLQSSLDDNHRVLPKVEKTTASASVSCLRNDINKPISLRTQNRKWHG